MTPFVAKNAPDHKRVSTYRANIAIAEMTQGGFGFHNIWTNLIEFIRKIDISAINRKLDERERG